MSISLRHTALFVALLASSFSTESWASTPSGIDTLSNVHNLPLAVGGNAVLTLTDTNGGSAGIGITTPLFPLHVVGAGGFGNEGGQGNVPIVFQSNSTGFGGLNGNGLQAFALNIDNNTGASNGRGSPTFYDKYDGNWHADITLKNGNVGIATTAPQTALDVNGQMSLNNVEFLSDTNTGNGINQRLGIYNWDGSFILANFDGSGSWQNNRLAVDASGNVWDAGSVSATAFYQTSDARLKTNIKTSKGLETISHLRGVTFDWKDGHGSSVGVLAQDVEKVIPTAVHINADGHKTVEYSQLIGPMIESIKALQVRVDGLEAENAELRRAIKP